MGMIEERKERVRWFCHDRFGMFVHFGLYSVIGRGEWVMSTEKIPPQRYEAYAKEFDPVGYDPASWARMAKKAGMKYVVMTAKHHDGYCLFDTKLTDYTSMTSCGRDLVREFVEAVRAEGLKVGLYYSLIDWHHPDYPKYADPNHPLRGNEAYKDEVIDFDRYLRYMHAQVEELVTCYGKLDILWFDYAYGDLRGEAWKATELINMVRKHQPHVLIDNRLEGSGEYFGSIISPEPAVFSGDFASPEHIIPPEGIRDAFGNPVPWELCTTINNNWGYHLSDQYCKSGAMLTRKLVECVSKGGNMILNIGPDGNGRVPDESVRVLEEIAVWMECNSAGIHGCDYAGLPKPDWGRYTRSGNKLYAHIFEAPIGPLLLTGVSKGDILRIRRLVDGSELRISEGWATQGYRDIPFVCMGEVDYFTYPLPDETDTVLEITLKE